MRDLVRLKAIKWRVGYTIPLNMQNEEFEKIVGQYYEDLFRFGTSLARNRDDASDLVQQTFEIFAEKHEQIRDAEKIKSWLFTTLYREFLRFNEQGKRFIQVDEVVEQLIEPTIESTVQRTAEQGDLLKALDSLEETQRAILTLFYLDQCSYKEIAGVLGIPVGTVMSRLFRAKEALRKKIEEPAPSLGIKGPATDSNLKKKK